MFSVYMAAEAALGDAWEELLRQHPDEALLVGRTSDLSEAVRDCRRDLPGVLLLDDHVLARDSLALAPLADLACPIVLVGQPDGGDAARRALAIRAKDLIPLHHWSEELLVSLKRAALPLYPRDRQEAQVLAVFSSKGGVGKTTLSVNLAESLAERTHESVIVVDLDLAFGDVATMLGLEPETTIYDLTSGSIDSARVRKTIQSVTNRLSLLAAPLAPEQAEDVTGNLLVRLLEVLKDEYAYVILDLAPGYHEINVTALDLADVVLTLCTPDVVTLRAVGQALTLFREDFRYPADKVQLVLNRTGSRTGIERSDVSRILKSPVQYELPSAGSLPVRAANQGTTFVQAEPSSPLAQAIFSLADSLAKEREDASGANRRTVKRGGWMRSRRS